MTTVATQLVALTHGGTPMHAIFIAAVVVAVLVLGGFLLWELIQDPHDPNHRRD